MAGFNWVLIVIIVVLAVLSVGVAVYLLISYQHPEDRTQAWFPKLVVLVGITTSIWTVLLFPLDIANRNSCNNSLPASFCTFAIPSRLLWYILYITNASLVFAVIPFAIFYYEADSELTLPKKVLGALLWEAATLVVIGCILGVCYALVGFTIYPVIPVTSGLLPLRIVEAENLTTCIQPANITTPSSLRGYLCDAIGGGIEAQNWTTRCSFPTYVIALAGVAGWLLFMMFAGVGLIALPVDCIKAFLGRPRSTITRSEFIKRAQGLGHRAKQIKVLAEKLKHERRTLGGGRKQRAAYNRLNTQLLELEEDHNSLEMVFPQGSDPGYMWALTVLYFWLKLAMGIVGACLTLCWLLQVVLYVFIYPPLTPFLNEAFIKLDAVFPLFGTFLFAVFCFYLIGATLMSSFLFNTALVLLSTNAVIQFCQQAFSLYATSSAISEIWGNQILHLQGIRYIFQLNIFLYCLFGFVGVTILLLSFSKPKKWVRKTKEKRLEEIYS